MLIVAGVLLVGALLVGLIGSGSVDGATLLGNSLGTVGIAVLTVTMTRLPSWSMPLAVVALVYLVGTDPATGRARPWAWLAWSSSTDRWLVNVGLYVGAGLAFSLTNPLNRADLG